MKMALQHCNLYPLLKGANAVKSVNSNTTPDPAPHPLFRQRTLRYSTINAQLKFEFNNTQLQMLWQQGKRQFPW